MDKLIPTSYINAKIENCTISGLSGEIGTEAKDYVGGLIGQQIGAIVDNCHITDSNYSVVAKEYAGGFVGLARDDVIEGTLSGALDIETKLPGMNPESLLYDCSLSGENITVTGTIYVGGFAGAMANTSAVNDTVAVAKQFDITASGNNAGGFAGKISGGHIQDSNAYNFSYVVGQITAGGYVGDLEPGNVASVLGDASILDGLVSVKDTLASVAQDFVPTIRNSSTTCIPCGGAVRAEAVSTTELQRGLAGGYVGHNEGGHIWGNNTKKWKGQDYTGPTSICEAVRIRSVYGAEIAGGFTGLMEAADTASAGSLSLLWGLVKADNLLGALSIVYPTEENTAVYGPLAKMDYQSWNSWVQYVGKYGGYGSDLAKKGTVNSQDALDAILGKYEYGYTVVAGRSNIRIKQP